MAKALITDAAGLALSADERAFFRDADPWGFIIFKRNVETPDQLRALTDSMRESVGRDAPILVDQEGGRVQRLGPPHWPKYPPGAAYGALYERDAEAGLRAAWLGARLIAHDLRAVGIDVDCLPIADVPVSEADPGDRQPGLRTDARAGCRDRRARSPRACSRAACCRCSSTSRDMGARPPTATMRCRSSSTDATTLQSTDFAAFRPLAKLPLGMTAHVVFTAIDPVAPATTSVTMVREVIRGHIGFDGLLMSDDISMNALAGTLAERARATLAAGCDVVLHCNGAFDERRAVADACPPLAGDAKRRADAALAPAARAGAVRCGRCAAKNSPR